MANKTSKKIKFNKIFFGNYYIVTNIQPNDSIKTIDWFAYKTLGGDLSGQLFITAKSVCAAV